MKTLITIAFVLVALAASAQITEEMSHLLIQQRSIAARITMLEMKSSARSPADSEELYRLRLQVAEIQKRIDDLKRQTP